MATWSIDSIQKQNIDSFNDVATVVLWQCTSDPDSNGNVASSWGHLRLETGNLNSESFTDFDSLTESQVIDWVKANLGSDFVSKTEASTDAADKFASIVWGLPSGW